MSYIYNLTDTWTAAGTSFSGIKMAITNTASAATSYMLNLTISGATTASFQVDKSGNLVLTGSVNKVTLTAPANGSTLTIADGKTFTASNTLTITGTDGSNVAFGTGGTVAYTGNNLSVFAATTSAQLAGVISDETGSGSLVFATSPTLVTPTLGVATATSVNKVTITAPATSATVTPTDGTTTVLSGGTLREVLTAARTYYVRTDGSDSNNGLANTAGGAFLTIQKAVNVVAALDISIYNVTIKIGNSGTFTGTVVVSAPWVGTGEVTLQGDTTTPANTIISTTSADAITVKNNGRLAVQAFKITTTTGGAALVADTGAIRIVGALDFGACAQFHIKSTNLSRVYSNFAAGAYTISGNAQVHWYSDSGSQIYVRYTTLTITGTPAFSSSFASASVMASIYSDGMTFTGSATGVRYSATVNGAIVTNGGGASYLPGNAGGSTATGGQYT